MEVTTDAVASPPRPNDSAEPEVGPGRRESLKTENDNGGIPNPAPHSRGRPKTRTSKSYSKCSPQTTINNYEIRQCHNVVVGSCININLMKDKDQSNMSKDKNTSQLRRSKIVKKLIGSSKVVDDDDIICVSEFIDPEGLKELGQLLGITPYDMNRVNNDFQGKGITEVIYQTLQLWKTLNTCDKQSAMLNLLCDKLCEISDHGGRDALEALYKRHFAQNNGSQH